MVDDRKKEEKTTGGLTDQSVDKPLPDQEPEDAGTDDQGPAGEQGSE